MSGSYDDVINLPHHVSKTRLQMPIQNRAAQFSPFAALTGYDAAINETGRLTDKQIELSESTIAELDMKLQILSDNIVDCPEAAVTYFKPDEKKDGGAYVTVIGAIKKIDDVERVIVFADGKSIAITNILAVEC